MSAYVAGTDTVTQHYDAGPVSYASADRAGNLTGDAPGAGLGFSQTWDRWISAVDVAGGPTPPHATVVLGDSISDGFNWACRPENLCTLTTPWPSVLAGRLLQLPAAQRTGVVNESITANPLTATTRNVGPGGGGLPGLTRLTGDVLSQPGVNRVVMLLGTNDLWFGATAAQLVAGYQQAIAAARAAGVGLIGATLLPRTGSADGWSPQQEAYREQVNAWIRTSHAFPVVIDLAAVMGDVYNGACKPRQLFPPYDSGDHLHPNTAGEVAMADSIPTGLLGAGNAPLAAPSVTATPTPGCPTRPVVTINSALPAVPAPVSATNAPSVLAPSGVTTPTSAPAAPLAPPSPHHQGVRLWLPVAAAAALSIAVAGWWCRNRRHVPIHGRRSRTTRGVLRASRRFQR